MELGHHSSTYTPALRNIASSSSIWAVQARGRLLDPSGTVKGALLRENQREGGEANNPIFARTGPLRRTSAVLLDAGEGAWKIARLT